MNLSANGNGLYRVGIALAATAIFCLVCHSQIRHSTMSYADILQRSGVPQLEALANQFKKTSDTNALAELCSLVADTNRNAGAGGLGALAPYLNSNQIATVVVPALARGLGNPRVGSRRECAIVLSQYYAEFAKPAIPELMKLLPPSGADAMNASIYAAELLGKIGPAAAVALPNLLNTLDQPESQPSGYEDLSVRVRAAEALGRIGIKSPDVRARVEKALFDSNPYVRAKSAQALLRVGGPARQAVETMVQLMESEDVAVRRFTLRTLEELDRVPDSLRDALKGLREDSDPELRTGLRNLLGARGASHP